MSGTSPAEEVADDYRYSLESLQSPDRFAINNLTVIAKESTEYADAIANVLVEHIRKAPPHHKLPALYVLDSVAKNIGTPYTLFLGHKLYSAFMGAYSSVDASTRRKMDEMLKTWKSPVPGALDPRPVFPVEITKKIDNALIQARTAVLKHEQNNPLAYAQKRPGSAVGLPQWRSTPTPPQTGMQYAPPPPSQYPQQTPLHQFPPGYPNAPTPNHFYQQAPPQPPYGAYQQPNQQAMPYNNYSTPTQQSIPYHPPAAVGQNTAALNQDIDRLIASAKHDLEFNHDTSKLPKLNALAQLRTIINSKPLSMEELANIRHQVDALQAAEGREQAQRASYQSVPPQPTVPTPLQTMISQFSKPSSAPPLAPPQDPRQSIPPPPPSAAPNLASMLASIVKPGAAPPPPPFMAQTPVPAPAPAPPGRDFSSLLASLTQSGVIPGSTPLPKLPGMNAPAATLPPPGVPASHSTNQSLANLLALATSTTPVFSKDHVELSTASLKISRPNLIQALLSSRPNQCVTCGRRFPIGPDGKNQKDRHMDWHFRTNQRIQDASKGIQNRSWYIGELEWTRSKDANEERENENGEAKTQGAASGSGPVKESYVSVPSDPDVNKSCPVCQETFETGFNQEIQDWVWLDATKVGNKIFHASCYADVKGGGGLEVRERTATPDSVLGKRKAEVTENDLSSAKRLASG